MTSWSETPAHPLRYAVVGSGWRAQFFLRMARALPERFELLGVVTRTAERGQEVAAAHGVPTWRSVADLLRAHPVLPDLVVTSTPWSVTPGLVRELVAAGVPVLAETPPAPDAPALRDVWHDVGASGLVQVAEHSPFLPGHTARARVLADGAVGRATSVHVSSTHQYHALALVRGLLRAGGAEADLFGPVEVTGQQHTAPLMDPRSRAGWTGATEPSDVTTTLALLDLGDGLSAFYDFTTNQPRNDLRQDRVLVRGSHGELADDAVQRWVDPRASVTSLLARRQHGIGQDMERADLEHLSFEGRVVYRNPYLGARLSDDDIAVATLLDRSRAWVRGDGEPPYPLAEAAQDHLVGLAVVEAARTRRVVRTSREPWAPA
ncbi:Gfo/Idh/MocA family oxidoreductase [Cellulomonas sp. APG4]|uniref:Gfo/Idh/MocA family oxidoreductase n=1 Tax=Cellulomonas sp. APG4 TaxID=1538656 RepID=UPI00137B1CBE|nr:Gfo/Idh/MocA family oxidoreductase [Cellulomonas sp. APG4]NCT91801.1 Gfo/Idh/MocA family oxidoreductase [Cellulomonas sp. APG4]